MITTLQLLRRTSGQTEGVGRAIYFIGSPEDPTGETKAEQHGERWREQDPEHNLYRTDRSE